MYHTYVLEELAMDIMKSAQADAKRRRMAACAQAPEPEPLCNEQPQEYDRRHAMRRAGGAANTQGGTA